MWAYVVGYLCAVNDDGLEEYRSLTIASVAKWGGELVAHGDNIEVAEGDWRPVGVAVLEFDSLERAKQWHELPDHQEALALLHASATNRLVFVDGG